MKAITPTQREYVPLGFFIIHNFEQSTAEVGVAVGGYGLKADLDFRRGRRRAWRWAIGVFPVVLFLLAVFGLFVNSIPHILGWR